MFFLTSGMPSPYTISTEKQAKCTDLSAHSQTVWYIWNETTLWEIYTELQEKPTCITSSEHYSLKSTVSKLIIFWYKWAVLYYAQYSLLLRTLIKKSFLYLKLDKCSKITQKKEFSKIKKNRNGSLYTAHEREPIQKKYITIH